MSGLLRRRCAGVAVALAVGMLGCTPGSGEDRHSIPATFVGTLEVVPPQRPTKALYLGLVDLGKRFGLDSRGDGATDDKQWQIQWFCGPRYVGNITTVQDGEMALVNLAVYGFASTADYDAFKREMLSLMATHGRLTRQEDRPRLSREQVLERGKHMKVDVTAECRPPAPSAAPSAPL